MRLGIFGGAFNPPHKGHKRLAETAREALGLDGIILIPSNISPQKSDNGNIDPLHRIRMCELTFSEPYYSVSDTEIKRGGRSYTFDTLCELKTAHPEAEFTLIMGSDMFLWFEHWYRFRDIADMCRLCTVPRDYDEEYDVLHEYCLRLFGSTDNVDIINTEPYVISSTAIRSLIGSGGDASEYLEPAVSEYIIGNKLYGYENIQ